MTFALKFLTLSLLALLPCQAEKSRFMAAAIFSALAFKLTLKQRCTKPRTISNISSTPEAQVHYYQQLANTQETRVSN